MGALSHIKVLDLSHFIAGPFCGQTLGDYGAEVIKVEPLNGEYSRKAIPMYKDISLYYSSLNRNKKSISIDLKQPEGKLLLQKLIKKVDVIITNYGVNVPEKLGFSYEEASKINPNIIMTHITGFGLTGPYKEKNAFDGIIQSMSGIVHLTGEQDGPPNKAGLYIADHIAGMQGVIGTLLALNEREKTGKGKLVDVSMLDSMVSMLAYNLADVTALKNNPQRAGNNSTNVFATTVETKDGFVYLAPLTQPMWEKFCHVIGKSEWAQENSIYNDVNTRLKSYPTMKVAIEEWTKRKNSIEVVREMEEAGVPCAKIDNMNDVLKNPQLQSRDMLMELDLGENYENVIVPGAVIKTNEGKKISMTPPPKLGEHTTQIMSQLAGMEENEIQDLLSNEVVYEAKVEEVSK